MRPELRLRRMLQVANSEFFMPWGFRVALQAHHNGVQFSVRLASLVTWVELFPLFEEIANPHCVRQRACVYFNDHTDTLTSPKSWLVKLSTLDPIIGGLNFGLRSIETPLQMMLCQGTPDSATIFFEERAATRVEAPHTPRSTSVGRPGHWVWVSSWSRANGLTQLVKEVITACERGHHDVMLCIVFPILLNWWLMMFSHYVWWQLPEKASILTTRTTPRLYLAWRIAACEKWC